MRKSVMMGCPDHAKRRYRGGREPNLSAQRQLLGMGERGTDIIYASSETGRRLPC